MKNLFLFILTFQLVINCYSQNLILDHTLNVEKYKLSFPQLVATDKEYESATSYINDFIQLQVLNKNISKSKTHLFEDIENKNCSYQIFTNSKTLFSIKLDAGYPFYLNFNSQNGRLLELPALFKEDKLAALYQKRENILKERISKKLASLPKDDKYEFISNFFKRKVDVYYETFFIKNNKIYLHTPNGNFELKQNEIDFNHNIDWDVEFGFPDIENLLSDFGKGAILNQGNWSEFKFETNSTKFLKGKIDNKYPITMIINLSYNNQTRTNDIDESFYWYNKVGKGLYLIGSESNNNYSIDVFDLKSRETKEHFNFKLVDGHYYGTWKDVSTGKELQFEAFDYYN